ncbi:MAG: hypothetical protein ACYTE3_21520, partial [Planctomycetota bacterium]
MRLKSRATEEYGKAKETENLSGCFGRRAYVSIAQADGELAGTRDVLFGRVYVVGECNRLYPARVVRVLVRCIKILFREKPDVVISTGAAAGCMLCLLGKMSHAKVVWIDSITNVERISLSGRMVRRIADLFLVQWPDLVNRYEKVEFAGAL